MAVDIQALRYGLRAPATTGRMICPECGARMKVFYRDEFEAQGGPAGYYGQCLNPECPHISKKEQNEMGTTMTATKSEFEVYPANDYLAQLTDYEETSGDYGPQVRLHWEFVMPKAYAGKTISEWCSKKLSQGSMPSKLTERVEALYKRPVPAGEVVHLDNLIGRQAILSIKVVLKKRKTEDGSGEEYERSVVTSARPWKNQEPFPAAKPAKPAKAAKPDELVAPEAEDEEEFDPFSETE